MAEFWRNKNGRLATMDWPIRGEKQEVEVPDGPWHAETDHEEFRHEGIPCLMLRGPQGSFCGYIALPPGHPWRDPTVEYQTEQEITYCSNGCSGEVCHVPQPGESDDVMWIGFDTAHVGDLTLFDVVRYRDDRVESYRRSAVYRTAAWVKAELEKMAKQAAEALRATA